MRVSKGAAKRVVKKPVPREPRADVVKILNRMADRLGMNRWVGDKSHEV